MARPGGRPQDSEQHRVLCEHLAQVRCEGSALSLRIEEFRPACAVDGRRRNGSFTGAPGSTALAFADTTRAEHQKYHVDTRWFVWTCNRSALLRVRPEPQFSLEVLWQGDGPHRLRVDPPDRTLRWHDGLTVFHLDTREAQQAAWLPPG